MSAEQRVCGLYEDFTIQIVYSVHNNEINFSRYSTLNAKSLLS